MSLVPQKWNAENPRIRRGRISIALIAILLAAALLASRSCGYFRSSAAPATPALAHDSHSAKNDAASRAAFMQVYRVFTSPRCQNCHPAGDAPLQGDDSHTHAQDVRRGPDGQGLYGMTCHACHQDANLPGANMPPGNPKWGLPKPEMKMVFVGRTPAQLCRQIKDPTQNGQRTLAQLLDHVANDDLVGWGWNPGDGRTLPPLSRPETVAAMKQWIAAGAPCPQ